MYHFLIVSKTPPSCIWGFRNLDLGNRKICTEQHTKKEGGDDAAQALLKQDTHGRKAPAWIYTIKRIGVSKH